MKWRNELILRHSKVAAPLARTIADDLHGNGFNIVLLMQHENGDGPHLTLDGEHENFAAAVEIVGRWVVAHDAGRAREAIDQMVYGVAKAGE